MTQPHSHITSPEESDFLRFISLFTRNYKVYIVTLVLALTGAFLFSRYGLPVYKINSSLLILEDNKPQAGNAEEYINSELFGMNQGFQNELYVLQSTPVIVQTVKNLNLTVNYFQKSGFRYHDAYNMIPISVLADQHHVQPVNIRFLVAIHDNSSFTIKARKKNVFFTNLYTSQNTYFKEEWEFEHSGRFGELIETSDLSFIINRDTSRSVYVKDEFLYSFEFSSVSSMAGRIKSQLDFLVTDREATVIEIGLKSTSSDKGIDIVNELMDVYSTQNVNRKNHIADVTIEYIERQLDEISDSLTQTEDNMQQFRSSRQLLDLSDQASGMSEQYMTLQNQLEELLTRKRYYDYLSEYIEENNDFSNVIVPSSMGIEDGLLNDLVSQLITAQAQRSNLIKNRQEKNPLVQRLEIQIENAKKTISENLSAVGKTIDISIDEMNKRINRVRAEISRVPKTQRQLGGIERNYRLNDAIYNYLLEKRAEAKISQASNLPDNVIIEPASMVAVVSPNPRKNYLFAGALGIMLPFAFFFFRSIISDKIEYQGKIESLTDAPLLGKIPHTRRKTNNVVFEYPKSGIAEAYRALRTNLEYRYKGKPHKVILITSSIEGEGKSFSALNIAMIYAQLGKRTLLVDFDMRKPTTYFDTSVIAPQGISTYMSNKISLPEIIKKTVHEKLDFIPSGPIPPNPIEMLASDEVKRMIEDFRDQYDIIVIDTPPLANVADAYQLIDYADIKIIVCRYNFTLKKVFHMIMSDLKQKKIENIGVLMNDNRISNEQYGYGYGYEHKKSWFKL